MKTENKRMISRSFSIVWLAFLILAITILFLPTKFIEFLSVNIVGTNLTSEYWKLGWERSGGDYTRIMAVIGLLIVCTVISLILDEKYSDEKRQSSLLEIVVFFIVAGIFALFNFIIRDGWWDSHAFLFIGPMFFFLLFFQIFIGVYALGAKKIFNFKEKAYYFSFKNWPKYVLVALGISLGYGLVSTLWHCCKLNTFNEIGNFAGIRLFTSLSLTFFYFGYGFKMLMGKFKPWLAYLLTALVVGLLTPYHTLGYIVVFFLFGLGLAELVRRYDSFIPAFIVLYTSMLAHAFFPWHGNFITKYIIIPLSALISLVFLVFMILEKYKKMKESSVNYL